jgi:hypothetical protein
MDFVRFEVLFRSELYENTFKKGIFPVLGSQKFIYIKPLKRWTKFSTTITLEGWDEKWAYHRQIFKQKNEVYAIGFTRVAFWKNKKAQNMSKILIDSGVRKTEMNPSVEILNMFNEDYTLIKNMGKEKLNTTAQD